MSNKKSTQQFIFAKDFKPERLTFENPKTEKLGARIASKYQYDDGTISDLVIVSPLLFSFGITDPPQKKDASGKPIIEEVKAGTIPKHVVAFVCWNREASPSKEETEFIEANEAYSKLCNENLKDETVRIALNQNLETQATSLKNILYYKIENGRPNRKLPPTISPKLLKDKQGNIKTLFTDPLNSPIEDPMSELYKQYFTGRVAIKYEGIWIGASPGIQIKAYQVSVKEKKTQSITALIPMELPLIKSNTEEELEKEETSSLNGDQNTIISSVAKPAAKPATATTTASAPPAKPKNIKGKITGK